MGLIAAAGALGGVANSLLTDGGFKPPHKDSEVGIWQIGFVGNILLGAFAAVLSWGLYGPLKDAVLVGSHPSGEVTAVLTVTALVGAALAGAGGSRIITSEIDKRLMVSAASNAAKAASDPVLASKMLTQKPADAAASAAAAATAAVASGGRGSGNPLEP